MAARLCSSRSKQQTLPSLYGSVQTLPGILKIKQFAVKVSSLIARIKYARQMFAGDLLLAPFRHIETDFGPRQHRRKRVTVNSI
jgi:hypothetical protein